MKKKKWAVALGIAVLTLTGALTLKWYFNRNGDVHNPVERVDDVTVRIYDEALNNIKQAKAITSDFPDLLYLMGKVGVTEDRTTVVPARVAGRTESIFFASGEYVTKGQLLMTLFSPDFVAAKEEYVQALKQVKSPPSSSDPSDFSNLEQMSRKKLGTMGLSESDIDSLSEATAKDSFLTIRSPRNGVIMAKGAVLGNLVNVGDSLFTIGDLSKVWFSGDIYPEDLPKIKKNQEVIINVEGLNKLVFGKVSFISPLVDPNTRSIKVRALMENPNGYLRQDMYVQGSVVLNKDKALLVPAAAIVRTPNGDVVFRRVEAQSIESHMGSLQFKKTPVKVNSIQRGMAAIADGLKDGDEVVTEGSLLLDGVLNSTEKVK